MVYHPVLQFPYCEGCLDQVLSTQPFRPLQQQLQGGWMATRQGQVAALCGVGAVALREKQKGSDLQTCIKDYKSKRHRLRFHQWKTVFAKDVVDTCWHWILGILHMKIGHLISMIHPFHDTDLQAPRQLCETCRRRFQAPPRFAPNYALGFRQKHRHSE